jgi:TonB family protein
MEVLMMRAVAPLLLSCCLMAAVAQDSPETITVPEETMQKLLIHKVKPLVPEETESPVQAAVVLNAIISKAGSIESLQMVSGDPMLVPAALGAVKQWRYRPYEVNGIPRAVETTIHVEFSNQGAETIATEAESPALATAEDMRGRLIYRVGPIYPPLARQARIQGMVILRVIINKLGEVRDTQVVHGHPMLSPAAVDAVKKWRYIPYEPDGRTTEIETEVQVIFTLAGT